MNASAKLTDRISALVDASVSLQGLVTVPAAEMAQEIKDISDELRRRAAIAPSDAWRGKFLLKPIPERAGRTANKTLPVVFRIHNMPTDDAINWATDLRPDAINILEDWRKVWVRALGNDGVNRRGRGNETQECTTTAYARMRKIQGDVAADKARDMRPGQTDANWYMHRNLSVAATGYIEAADWERHPGLRDWRTHIIDDAVRTLSLAHGKPYFAAIRYGKDFFILTGVDPQGLPILKGVKGAALSDLGGGREDAGERISLSTSAFEGTVTLHEENVSAYWRSKTFHELAGRKFYEAATTNVVPFILAEMALDGHTKAFAKTLTSKGGTWTIDLAGVETPRQAAAAVASAAWPYGCEHKLLLQEHVAFVLEHRYFVVDGRVAASSASVRDFCGLDGRADRILDERMARLTVPAKEPGPYDRGVTEPVVDRASAARCARMARDYARRARDEGRRDYVIDIGITDDGRCLPIELNELGLSGPYAVDHKRIVRAHNRRIERADRWLAETVETARAILKENDTDGLSDEAIDMIAWEEVVRINPAWRTMHLDGRRQRVPTMLSPMIERPSRDLIEKEVLCRAREDLKIKSYIGSPASDDLELKMFIDGALSKDAKA